MSDVGSRYRLPSVVFRVYCLDCCKVELWVFVWARLCAVVVMVEVPNILTTGRVCFKCYLCPPLKMVYCCTETCRVYVKVTAYCILTLYRGWCQYITNFFTCFVFH
jgi:hypothetical protein